jgi:hypothetical protein
MTQFEPNNSEYQRAVQTETNEISSERSLDRTTCLDILDSSLCDNKRRKIEIQVFGSDIRNKSPFRIGNVYGFIYCKESPLFTLGPNCI